MKATEAVLVDFIKDFKLELPGVGVCFNADIEFTGVSGVKMFNSEVHIITMALQNRSFIYILCSQLAESGIPDIFPFDAENFMYIKRKKLQINDYDLLRGKFCINIVPIVRTTRVKKSSMETMAQ
ncbi:MAG: hypothetical protein JST81_10870 [Bacteroidetes bacterium]|jgi:hypothetical protein|nr:hypothetical protein [Bacteroidota bacterium]